MKYYSPDKWRRKKTKGSPDATDGTPSSERKAGGHEKRKMSTGQRLRFNMREVSRDHEDAVYEDFESDQAKNRFKVSLWLGPRYQQRLRIGCVRVRLIEAANLPAADLGGKSDPRAAAPKPSRRGVAAPPRPRRGDSVRRSRLRRGESVETAATPRLRRGDSVEAGRGYEFLSRRRTAGVGRATNTFARYVRMIMTGKNKHGDEWSDAWRSEQKSDVKKKTLNPYWYEDHEFFVRRHDAVLRVEVYDKDVQSEDDILGFVEIPVKDLSYLGLVKRWFPLEVPPEFEAPAAAVHLHIRYDVSALGEACSMLWAEQKKKPDSTPFDVNGMYRNGLELQKELKP